MTTTLDHGTYSSGNITGMDVQNTEKGDGPVALKLGFYTPSVESELGVYTIFINEQGGDKIQVDFILKEHPQLKSILEDTTSNLSFTQKLEKYLSVRLEEDDNLLNEMRDEYEEIWEKYGQDFVKNLEQVLECKFEDINSIMVILTTCPTSPRDIRDRMFWASSTQPLTHRKRIIAEEVLHFLYYKKWEEVFGKLPDEDFSSPSPIWYLSEILVAPILKLDSLRNSLGGEMDLSAGYNGFEEVKIDGVPAGEYFAKMFTEYRRQNYSFDRFLKDAFEVIKPHEKQIREIFSDVP